ncbi:hypothetical protein GF314_07080 [bacterium]|nr:hypothetical protein [bacterium]
MRTVLPALLVVLSVLAVSGCSDRDVNTLQPATGEDDPVVFSDAFEGGLDYSAFEFSYYDAFTIDAEETYRGTASLKVTLTGREGETWAGGSFFSQGPRDLSAYNALVFHARASRSYTLNAAGFGLGIAFPSDYQSEVPGIQLSEEWARYVIPIPNSARMTVEHGLFWYSATTVDEPVEIWFDEVEFASIQGITNPRPVMSTRSVQALVGERFEIPGTRTTFNVGGRDILVYHTDDHFDFFSSDESVVTAEGNVVTGVSLGEATVTAKLGEVDVQGEITAKVVTEITRPEVFIDGFDTGLDFGSFGDGQYLEALSIDDGGGMNGSAAIKITIPTGRFAGGAIYSTDGGRDLTSFNALVFDARADQDGYVLGNIGYGIGLAAGGTDYQAEIQDVELGTDWRQVVVPIPDPARLTAEAGVWWYSAGQSGEIWFDNIRYATLDQSELSDPRPVMDSTTLVAEIGQTVDITGTGTTFDVDGTDVDVVHGPLYYTYGSSDEDVATAAGGVVTVVGGGTATITATLGTVPVDGEVTVSVIAPPDMPAPTPTDAPADVISIYSDAYDDIAVDTWLAEWTFGGIEVEDQQIQGDDVKAYTGFNGPAFYTGIEFTNDLIDAEAAGMTHFHMDIYVPVGTRFGFKLVDFGDDGVFGGGDDTEFQVDLDADSTPPLVTGEWISLDLPLTDFAGMNFGHVAQIVLAGIDTGSLWIDNVYFHD